MELVNCPDCFAVGQTKEKCAFCDGSGRQECGECEGSGSVHILSRSLLGGDDITCPRCRGSKVENHCLYCASSGHILERCTTCSGLGKLPSQKAFGLIAEREKQKQEAQRKADEARKIAEAEAKRKAEESRKAQEERARVEAATKAKWEAEAPMRAAAEKKAKEEREAAQRKAEREKRKSERKRILRDFFVAVSLLGITSLALYSLSVNFGGSTSSTPSNFQGASSSATTQTSQTVRHGYFVVLGSFKTSETQKANNQLQAVKRYAQKAYILDTRNHTAWKKPFLIVTLGPYNSKSEALSQRKKMLAIVPDAFLKKG